MEEMYIFICLFKEKKRRRSFIFRQKKRIKGNNNDKTGLNFFSRLISSFVVVIVVFIS
jgi:hypothetical protein